MSQVATDVRLDETSQGCSTKEEGELSDAVQPKKKKRKHGPRAGKQCANRHKAQARKRAEKQIGRPLNEAQGDHEAGSGNFQSSNPSRALDKALTRSNDHSGMLTQSVENMELSERVKSVEERFLREMAEIRSMIR